MPFPATSIAPEFTGRDTEKVVSRTEELISKVSEVLVEAAHPKRIILFGSRARGDSRGDSDFDVIVVQEQPADRLREMVRLNHLLRKFDAAIDLLVVSEDRFQYWRDTPGKVYHEAASQGRTHYDAA
jgi:predicted nucleotidyltransferase